MSGDFITIHTDGGSRGNPGPAASAFVVEKDNTIIFEGSKYLGKATNNFAEYTGVIIALEWFIKNENQHPVSNIHFVLDSELVVRQLNGVYKVKDLGLQKLSLEVKNLINKIDKKVIFTNVPREQNKEADVLVNNTLDQNIL